MSARAGDRPRGTGDGTPPIAWRWRLRLAAAPPERIADGVWVVRGGLPRRTMNAYLLRDGDGVTMFDSGVRQMTPGLAAAARSLGGLRRVVLGHAHADHRGGAPGLGAPVWCHPAEQADAEGDGGMGYFHDTEQARASMRRLAALRPAVAWSGHADPLRGDVAAQLERAAEAA